MNTSYLFEILVYVFALCVGLVVHESAHALAAYALGDSTARERGRVSLNPLKHIDPFGTIILPLICVAAGGPVFAYAKPVPIYVNNLRHPKRDQILVSLAGPASNLVLAFIGALVLRLGLPALLTYNVDWAYALLNGCLYFMSVNLSLCFFNLIPIPPLDGSSVLVALLRGKARDFYYKYQRYAMLVLIVILYVLPGIFNIDLVGMYFDVTLYPVLDALLSFALSW